MTLHTANAVAKHPGASQATFMGAQYLAQMLYSFAKSLTAT